MVQTAPYQALSSSKAVLSEVKRKTMYWHKKFKLNSLTHFTKL